MRFLLGMMLMLAGGLLQAEEFAARVIAVMDGDTVLVLRDNKKIKIRLADIDAPESAQPFGKESRQALLDRVVKKLVRVNSRAVDSYGRLVAELSVDDVSVNAEMVRSGMAWEYSHFHRNKHYRALQSEAQQSHLGLWSATDNPIKPEMWRKLHPSPDHATHHKTGCGKKTRCVQMLSCEEATFHLKHCGAVSLDANGDGIPCESLCVKEK